MDLLKNRFLFYPLLFLAGAFCLDKIFLLPEVREYTRLWNQIEAPLYATRSDLLEQLKRDYPARQAKGERLGLILGTSRAAEFNSAEIARYVPNSYTYNFSAPLAASSYHFYWLEKILEAGIKPRFVILEADPMVFHPISIGYSLAYSYDRDFVFSNYDFNRPRLRGSKDINKAIEEAFRLQGRGFSFDETETFILKNLFALYKYPIQTAALRKNGKKLTMPAVEKDGKLVPVTPDSKWSQTINLTGREFRRWMLKRLNDVNRNNLGGIPNMLLFAVPPRELEERSRADAKKYLSAYKPAPTQIIFFKRILATLARHNVKTVIYWPLVTPLYRKEMEKKGLVTGFQVPIRKEIQRLETKHKNVWIRLKDPDKSPELTCRSFVDSNHLSGRCYNELTSYLLGDLKL